MDLTHPQQVNLTKLIIKHFSQHELEELCFLIGISIDNLPATTHNARAQKIVQYCVRHGQIDVLLNKLRELRQNVDWHELLSQTDDVSKPKRQKTSAKPSVEKTGKDSRNSLQNVAELDKNGEKKEEQPPNGGVTKDKTPILQIFITNFIFVGLIAYFLAGYFKLLSFCTPTTVSALSLSMIIVLAVHCIWRVSSPALDVAESNHTIKFLTISLPIKPVQSVINAFHPWHISNQIFWVSTIILAMIIGFLGLSSVSPFSSNVLIPNIVHYSIIKDGEPSPQKLLSNQRLLLAPSELATVTAIGSDGLNCEWRVAHDHGTLISQDGCTVTFVTPQEFETAFLEITASTDCHTSSSRFDSIRIVNSEDSS